LRRTAIILEPFGVEPGWGVVFIGRLGEPAVARCVVGQVTALRNNRAARQITIPAALIVGEQLAFDRARAGRVIEDAAADGQVLKVAERKLTG
jgi:hypothetical protein